MCIQGLPGEKGDMGMKGEPGRIGLPGKMVSLSRKSIMLQLIKCTVQVDVCVKKLSMYSFSAY